MLDTARRVLLTFAASEAGHNFTIFGTSQSGVAISEVIAGTGAGTVASVLNYKTVTRIAISAGATGNVSAGTNGVGASDWRPLNLGPTPFQLGLALVITGTVTVDVNYTYEDPNVPITPGGQPTAFALTALSAKSASTDGGAFNIPIAAIQLVVTAGTGSATLVVDQAGIGSP